MSHLSLLTHAINNREFNEPSEEYKEPSSIQIGLACSDVLVAIVVINAMTKSNLRGKEFIYIFISK